MQTKWTTCARICGQSGLHARTDAGKVDYNAEWAI